MQPPSKASATAMTWVERILININKTIIASAHHAVAVDTELQSSRNDSFVPIDVECGCSRSLSAHIVALKGASRDKRFAGKGTRGSGARR